MIAKFREAYAWLSNFYSVPITFRGVLYQSVEAAYMSAKCDEQAWKDFCADPMSSAGQIKRASYELEPNGKLVKDWLQIKVSVMEHCLREKFNVPYLHKLLVETGDQNIQEGNMWKDDFWGVRLDVEPNYGENNLGRLIMMIRDEKQGKIKRL